VSRYSLNDHQRTNMPVAAPDSRIAKRDRPLDYSARVLRARALPVQRCGERDREYNERETDNALHPVRALQAPRATEVLADPPELEYSEDRGKANADYKNDEENPVQVVMPVCVEDREQDEADAADCGADDREP
jgi:hypothetical protein